MFTTRIRRTLFVFAIALLLLAATACDDDSLHDLIDGDTTEGDSDDPSDGDTPDGDIWPDGDIRPDGDIPDGDKQPDGDGIDGDNLPDGDVPDGDTPDGDAPDGDITDGDEPDGDTTDGDQPDGDTSDGDADGDEPEGSIRVGTYNTYRLFDKICNSGQCESGDYEVAYDDATFDRRIRETAQAIDAMDLDIVCLQEIENSYVLNALAAATQTDFPIVIIGETNYPASVDVALLARGTHIETRTHRSSTTLYRPDGTTTTFAREFLEVHIGMDNQRVIVFVAHFKAKANDDPGRRLAEAQAAHDIVTRRATEFPSALILLGGDLNDTPGSDPIDALEDSGKLLRAAAGQPLSEIATYEYYGQKQAIDHLFIAKASAGQLVAGSAQAVHGQYTFGLGGSDHAALTAVFMLPQVR